MQPGGAREREMAELWEGKGERGCCVSYGCGKVGIGVKHVSTCEVRINVFPNTCR